MHQIYAYYVTVCKILQESLTHDYDAKYWTQRYSLKDGIPSFLANISGTILTTGKYLNVMRECGHHVQVLVNYPLQWFLYYNHPLYYPFASIWLC